VATTLTAADVTTVSDSTRRAPGREFQTTAWRLRIAYLGTGIFTILIFFLVSAVRGLVIGSRPGDHYFRSVCLFVCAEFFSAVFDPISIKFGRMLYVWV